MSWIGGVDAISMYELGAGGPTPTPPTPTPTPPTPTPTPPPPTPPSPTPGDYMELGCVKDDRDNRVRHRLAGAPGTGG